jgi:hypothetical protein
MFNKLKKGLSETYGYVYDDMNVGGEVCLAGISSSGICR